MQKIIDRNMQFFISNLPLSSPNALSPTGLLSRLTIVPVAAQIRKGRVLKCNFYSTTPAPNEVILITAYRWLSFAPSLARPAGRSYYASRDISLDAVEAFLARNPIAMVGALLSQELQQRPYGTNSAATLTTWFPVNPERRQHG